MLEGLILFLSTFSLFTHQASRSFSVLSFGTSITVTAVKTTASEAKRRRRKRAFASMASKEVAVSTATDAEPHDASAEGSEQPQKELYPMVNWKYDLFLYGMGNLVNLFFREVIPRGAWRVPQTGPVLFVAAPHANQVWQSSLFFFSASCDKLKQK